MSAAACVGILAVWHNCAAGSEQTFEHWYQSEHLAERVGVPGFRVGRRYEGLGGYRSYFTYYETDEPGVLTSKAYLDRVNDPTPLTRTVMDGIFVDSCRTVCRRVARVGDMKGAYAVTVVTNETNQLELLQALGEQSVAMDGVASAEVWAGVDGASDTGSREQQIRGGDETIAGSLLVSTLRQSDGDGVVKWLAREGIAPDCIGLYRLLCELRCDSGT